MLFAICYAFRFANIVIFSPVVGDDYPAVKDYLPSFGIERLEQTGEEHIGNGERVKARKKTTNKWFETQDAIAYWGDFARPKIVWGEISDRSKFAYDSSCEFVPEATTFLMTGHDLSYLLCLLNSPLTEWFFSKLGTTTGVGTVRWKKYTIEQLLIPTINEDLKKLFSNWVDETKDGVKSTDELAEVANAEIYNILHLSKDEIAYVEGFYPPLKASSTDH